MSTNQFNRQKNRNIVVDLGVDQMGAGNEVTAKLPMGAVLTAVQLLGVTAFDSATTATASVSDGTTDFVDGVDVKTTGNKTAAGAPKYYPQGGELVFSLAETGAGATAGRAIAIAIYVMVGAGDEIYG